MVTEIIALLKTGLSIWQSKEARKYLDKVISLEKDWYEAYNAEDRNNALLDNIEFELRVVSRAFRSEVGDAKA